MWLLSLHVTQVLSISSAPWDEFFQSWFTSRALVLIQGIQKVLELWSWVGMGQEQGWGCSGLSGFLGVGRKSLPRMNSMQWNKVFPRNGFYSQDSSSFLPAEGPATGALWQGDKIIAKFVLSSLMVGGWIMQCY